MHTNEKSIYLFTISADWAEPGGRAKAECRKGTDSLQACNRCRVSAACTTPLFYPDQKDPKTIAKLVTEGRYSFPYIPEGIYAELREAISVRDQIVKALNATSNRIQRWLKIYFPEYLEVYKVFDSVSGLAVLKKAPLPKDVIELGVDGIVNLWREKKLHCR